MSEWLDEKWAAATIGLVNHPTACTRCGRSIRAYRKHWVLRMGNGARVATRGSYRFEIRHAETTLHACLDHQRQAPALGEDVLQLPQPQLPPRTDR